MRLLIFLLIFPALSFASGHRAVYTFKYMVFTVGTVEYTFRGGNGTYQGIAYGYAQGIASLISGGRRETHFSKMVLEDGILKPQFYSSVIERKNKIKRKWMEFLGDKVKVEGEKVKKGKVKRKKPYFINNATGCYDPISLFENFPRLVEKRSGSFSFCVITPTGKKKFINGRFLGKNDKLPKPLEDGEKFVAAIYLPRGILPFKHKKVYLYFTKDMVLSRAYIKNVAFFGDLTVTLLKWEKL